MRMRVLLWGAMCALAVSATAQSAPALTPWTLQVSPQLTLPLFDPHHVFSLAYGSRAAATYQLDADWEAGGALGFHWGTLHSDLTTVASLVGETSVTALGAWRYRIAPPLFLRTQAGASLVYGVLTTGGGGAVYASFEAGIGLGWTLSPEWTLRFDTGWVQKTGLYGGLQTALSVAWTVPRAPSTNFGTPPSRLRLLEFTEPRLGSVFPIFQTYYDEHAIGTIRVTNTGNEAASNLKVSFFVRQYMDAPKDCLVIPTLAPGASQDVPVFALFRNNILDVTEATKAAAEVTVEYQTSQGLQTQTSNTSLRVYDRNALTWDDDRKAAAFVSGKDPWVLDLSNNLTAAVKDLRNSGVNKNLQTALAFHNGLRLYGLSYVINPKNPFAKAFANPEAVDFVKFPRQTLAYKAGDCSDLSVLYASMLESVGIETAFITVPGHIFLAYNLDLEPSAARATLSRSDDLIVQGGKTWMPLEVTMRDAPLADLWHEAAREWRQGQAEGTAGFYPVHEAWKTFAPVGLPADASTAEGIPRTRIAASFESDLAQLVAQELAFRLAPLNEVLKTAATPKTLNSRGVVYARFERWTEAEKDFQAANAKSPYAPALINLGNLALLRLDSQAAFEAYQRAATLAPENARLQINLARAAQALGKTTEATRAWAVAQRLDPELASHYGSLGTAEPGNRAAQKSDVMPLWDE